jgi:uncharacterized membrane protein/mono/diheme cytochrome c family protein
VGNKCVHDAGIKKKIFLNLFTHHLFMLLNITEFIGHFHPILVHLPIGILLIAVLFQLLSQKEKYKSLHSAIGVSLFIGMLSAIASCISGFLLSQTGDYDEQLVFNHQWLGIGTAFISMLAYFFYTKNKSFLKWIMVLLAVLIIITGHLGGSLTHGAGYLTQAFSNSPSNSNSKTALIANVQEALVYNDIIQPIFQSKCYSCHGTTKQKGKLRLDEPSFILQGGEDGKIIIPGSAGESEMIKRLLLAADNKEHMPPKEKPQLSKAQIELLHWWITSGASFDKKTKDLPQTDKIKPALLALQSGIIKEENNFADIPAKPVAKAADSAIQKLKALGVVVVPVAQNSNYVSANFIAAIFTDKDVQLLEPLAAQLIWLKLGNTKISDTGLSMVSKLTGLTKLYAENTPITDKGLGALKSLLQLQYLNITGTKTTVNGILQLKNLKNLQQIFLYKTQFAAGDYLNLKKTFPAAIIDTGGYKVETLAADTMLVKQPKGN